MGLSRFISVRWVELPMFLKVWKAAYGAIYQGQVLRVRVCWQRGTQKVVNMQSSS